MHPQKFNPEITTYLEANGFKKVDEQSEIGSLTFRKGETVIQFWNDKIEKRIISTDKTKVNNVLTAFKGYDGKSIFKLMLILHLMDAVDLKTVSSSVYTKLGKNIDEELQNEFNLFQIAM